MEKYVTAVEVAEAFGVCTETVARWRRGGMDALPLGIHYRYRLSECEAWLRERAVARGGEGGQAEVVPLHERRTA